MKTLSKILIASAAIAACACSEPKVELTKSGLDPQDFVNEYNGQATALYTLTNANGMEVCITNFGGRIVSIMVPDNQGELKDVVLGFDKVSDYFPENNSSDFGASIGRYANRINKGQIVVDGQEIQLPQNNFGHCLHGGPTGWQYQVYEANLAAANKLELTRISPDGDNNFPGNVVAKTTYTLTEDNKIDITYEATTDKTTIINMTNHSYFNLSGDPNTTVLDHICYLNADNITPIDETCMTSGEFSPVAGTAFDFLAPHAIGDRINETTDEQIANGNGYDHNWVLNTKGDDTQLAACVKSPATGIILKVYTNEPGIQFYTGNFLDGTVTGKKGIVYNMRAGLCLESQKYPDSPNKEWAESNPYLQPGEKYYSHCVFAFSAE